MKNSVRNTLIAIFVATLAASFGNGCGNYKSVLGQADTASVASQSFAAGGGGTVPGTGSLSVPTSFAVAARIQNGLSGKVSSASGNFAKAFTQLKTNLPKVSDPTKATGYDQIQLLVYAACSDLTTGATPLMQSSYNVTASKTIADNKAALIAAGIKMFDQHVAGLASAGPIAADASKIFSGLVDNLASGAGNTSTIAFMSVCIAANSAGVTLMGF